MKNFKLWCFGLSFLIISIFNSSCQKDKCQPKGNCDSEIGVFIEMENCTLAIELENGQKLEDIGFRLWSVKVNGCTPYCVKYTEQPAATTTCSGAIAVELLEATEL